MKNLLISCCFLFLSVGAAAAQTDTKDLPETIIQQQIDAFLADDFDRAFAFASPTIQGVFGSAPRFGAMVKQGYPMVWRPADVRFLNSDGAGELRRQNVLVTDQAGRLHLLEYEMIRSGDSWRINGVRLVPQVGA